MSRARRPYDIVHVTHSAFPEDPRPRREAAVAADTAARVAVVALQDGRSRRAVGHVGRILVVRLPGRRRRGSIAKYLVEYTDFILRVHRLFRRDARFRGARVVHVHTLPDFLIAGVEPARRAGARTILDLHEIFPEFTRSKFPGAGGRLGERIARWLERWSRRRADVTLTVNRPIAAALAARPAKAGERIVVIHNLSDPAEFGPERAPAPPDLPGVRLVYHGTLTGMYGLDLAIDAVAAARAAGIDCSFDVFGGGPDADALARQSARLGLDDRVRLHGPVSHDMLRERLPTFHAGLVPTRLNVMTRFSLSTKLLEYVHLGIPLLAPRIPTYLEYLPEDCLWYFEANDAAAATRAIIDFAAAPRQERVRRATNAQAAMGRLRWAGDAATLRAVYRDLLAPDAQPR